MIRKQRMGKGIAKILSSVLIFGMVAGIVPAVPGGTMHAKAEDVSEPSMAAYATKEQLMTAFTPDADGNVTNVGKLLFGKNASGDAQDWYILEKDAGVNGDNTIIFAASLITDKIQFNNELSDKTYNEGDGTYADGNPTDVYSNHYGASNLRITLQNIARDTNYFSDAEQALMQATTVTTTDTKNRKNYITTDVLYAPTGNHEATSLKAGSDNSVLLQRSTYWNEAYDSEKNFWLRSPSNEFTDSAYFAYVRKDVENGEVNIAIGVRPVTNLNLSDVLFASAFNVKSKTIEEAMTLRLDGENKGIGTATYNASTKGIKVDRGSTMDTVYLIVQYKSGGEEKFYGQPIERSQDVTLPDDIDLSKCKIWLETADSDGMIYAVEAIDDTTPANYEIINGANSSWTQNTDGSLAIRGNGEFAKFQSVKVDGVVIDPVNYTVTEGSTIITLNAAYLQTLSAGSHTFEIVWTDGSASTSFTVAANTPGGNNNDNNGNNGNNNGSSNTNNNQSTTVNTSNTDGSKSTTTDSSAADTVDANQSAVSPKTGEDFSMALCTTLLMVSCAGLAGMFVRRKKSSLR